MGEAMDQPVAIVTGAGRGIGRAAAVELAKRKYRLSLVSRTASQLEETGKLFTAESLCIPADISQHANVQAVVEKTLTRFGRADALVHCAGVAYRRSVEELTLAEWQQTLEVNLSAVFYFCRILWPVWTKQGGGVVVNVSSYSARDPFDGLGAYGAAKAGVNLLGLALAREGEQINVRVHTVAPSATETAMFRTLLTPMQFPKENALDPADVARVIAQCVCGDLTYSSGEVIYVHKTF
jgi:NAD(P)-dependent dehydrogenase (short-subunit alcohol dehydrogenase family)